MQESDWRGTLTEIACILGVDRDSTVEDDELYKLPEKIAMLQYEKKYWQEVALMNSRDAERAEKAAAAWKACAKKYRR